MRTIALAVAVGVIAGCATLTGEIDDGGRAYRQTIDAPVAANLEPLAAEPSIRLVDEPLPERGAAREGARRIGGEPASACQAELWQRLVGMSEAEVRQEALPETYRVVAYDAIITQEYLPDRLTIHLDRNGDVFRVVCG